MKFEIKNLRVGLLAFLLSAFSFSAFAAFNFVGVYTTTNGALLAPTNFFKVNSNLLNAAVAASGGGTSTNGLASTNYVNTATNTLWLVLSNADWNTLQSMAALSNAHRAALTWTTNRFDTQALTNAALQAGIDGKLAQTLTNNPPMFVNGDAVIPLLHAAPGDFWVPQDSLKDWEWSINISGHAATATDPDAVHTGDIGNTVLAPNGDGSGLDLSGNTSVSAANVTGLGTMALEDAGSFIAKTDGEANGTFRFVGTNYVTNTNLLWTDCGSGLSLWTWSGNRYTNIYTAPPFDLGYVTNRSGVWTLCGSGGSVVSSNLSFPTGQWLPEGECFLDSHYGWTTNAVTVNDGNVSANSFTGNGSGVTHINPANIDAGTAAIDISGNAATAATANSAQSLLEGIGGNTFAYAEDGDNPRWVSSLQIYAPNFSGNVGSTNITGALTNNTTGNAATASAGWPTSWSGASITSAVAQATHATNADVAASGWPVFSVSAGANITVTTNVSGANTNYTVTGSAGSGVTNGQSNVSFGTLTLTNTLALGGTNDADGKFIAKITSSNSPSTFNFTMQANPQTTNRADNVFYWGWNQGSGGGQDVANEACLYHGIEREWLGQFEDYIHFRSTTNGVSYRPLFYGITRDSGICQKIEKLDTWQMMAGSNHLDEILNFNGTNSGYFKPPVSFYEYVKFYDRAGAYRSAFTNGILVSYGVNFNPDGSGSGLWLSQDTSLTNNNLVGMTANYWRTRNATGTLTNLYQNGGVTVGTNSWQVTVGTDVAGVQINNGNGAQTTFLSLGNAGVADRTVLYCIGSTDNSAVGGHAQYDTLLKSKKGVFFSANDSAQNDMQVSNRWVFVNGSVTVTGSLTAGTNLTARAHAYTTVAAAPTLANIGATNVWFTWASNGSPGVLVASYYDGGSNIVSKTLAP